MSWIAVSNWAGFPGHSLPIHRRKKNSQEKNPVWVELFDPEVCSSRVAHIGGPDFCQSLPTLSKEIVVRHKSNRFLD